MYLDRNVAMLAAAGAAAVSLLTSVLLLLRGAGTRVPGCGAGSGCDAVTSSRWARIGPIPIALPAAIVYAAMIACALAERFAPPHFEYAPLIWQALLSLTALAWGAAVWFLALQLLVLRRFCVYCVIAHLAALAAAAVIATQVSPIPHRWDDPTLLAIAPGVGALMLLILVQLIVRPKLHRIAPPEEVMPEPEPVELESEGEPEPELEPTTEPDSAVVVEEEPEPEVFASPPPELPPTPTPPPPTPPPSAPPRPSRPITLLGGRLHFDSAVFPILGPPNAKFIIAVMMDYTCEFCRRLHPMLDEALASFNGELATLIVFSPLEPACNPLVEEFEPKHVNACAYARLALAVAAVDEAQFPAFHRWLFTGEHPPSVEEAEQAAAQVVGGDAVLRDALARESAKKRLNDGVTLYRITGKGALPRVLLPTGVLMGEVSDSGYLMALLRRELTAQEQQQQQQQPPIMQSSPPVRPPSSRPSPFSDRPIA